MKTKKLLQECGCALCALLMAVAPGLDFSVQGKVLPDAQDFFGFLDQCIARTFRAVGADTLTLALLFAAFWFLCRRYLYHKPKGTGVGEYLLCGGLCTVMTLYGSIKATGSIVSLYANGFQAFKTVLFFAGLFFILLVLLRGLNELLLSLDTPTKMKWSAMERHPFAVPALVIALCWLPQILVKYPGVLMWDSYQQIKQYIGEYARVLNHPPFGTWLYGVLYTIGRNSGLLNQTYFAFTLLQCACLIGALAYSLLVMRRLSVHPWVRYGALLLYAVSPCYSGWAVVIGKDASYLLLCILLCTLLLEWSSEGKRFLSSWGKPLLLCADLTLMMLTRHNGVLIAIPVLLWLAVSLLRQKGSRIQWSRLAACCALAAMLTVSVEALLIHTLNIQKSYMQDTLSLPFQQTARVVKLHGDELPQDEQEIINRVLDYASIGESYEESYADAVKDTYRQEATAEDRAAYFMLWLRQLTRYPTDYLDALLHMNGVMFDLQSNYPMYISLSDSELTDYVYPMSFNDMTMYDREPLKGLNSAQRALTRWYDCFDQIPLLGMFASIGFCNFALLMVLYLAWVRKRKSALLVMLPALMTALNCLFSPVVYLRYALPMVCTLPFWFAAVQKQLEGYGGRQ
ncbi:MAG: DUF6020 family protein [Eubacteriales bacterium]|nr:DUF6020 family protein [Eubacteriales bacterium]